MKGRGKGGEVRQISQSLRKACQCVSCIGFSGFYELLVSFHVVTVLFSIQSYSLSLSCSWGQGGNGIAVMSSHFVIQSQCNTRSRREIVVLDGLFCRARDCTYIIGRCYITVCLVWFSVFPKEYGGGNRVDPVSAPYALHLFV